LKLRIGKLIKTALLWLGVLEEPVSPQKDLKKYHCAHPFGGLV
jgi:hypothetical protein